MKRKYWIVIGVIIAIALLLYWLFMAEMLEETVAVARQTTKIIIV